MESFTEAAQAGNINDLYASIRSNPKFLNDIDKDSFVDSPLHVAASVGQTHFAIEFMSLKPSFGRKLNPDGLSPLHLALQNKHSNTVKRLIKLDSELIRVKGRERLTALHYVAKTDDIELLAEFLCVCPRSIEDLTIREESALHIAVKNSNHRAFKVLFEWLWRTYKRDVVSWRDEEGNTVLHIAVATNQHQIVRLLVRRAGIIINQKNLDGLTALDIAIASSSSSLGVGDDEASIASASGSGSSSSSEVRNILCCAKASKASSLPKESSTTLADILVSEERPFEVVFRFVFKCRRRLSMEMRNVLLVIAVLIATATFQAALSPPGGISLGDEDNNHTDTATNTTATAANKKVLITTDAGKFTYTELFYDFYSYNTAAFIASITVIITVLPFGPLSLVLHLSMLFLAISYGTSMFYLSPSGSLAASTMVMTLVPYLAYIIKISMWFMEMEMEIKLAMYYNWLRFFWDWIRPFFPMGRLRMLHRLVG